MLFLFQIGPVRFPARVNGDNYLQFLRDVLPGLIENLNLPPHTLENLVFMHDGAAPHFSLNVRDYLNRTYTNRWIGRGGPFQWCARSPDLTPVKFFFMVLHQVHGLQNWS